MMRRFILQPLPADGPGSLRPRRLLQGLSGRQEAFLEHPAVASSLFSAVPLAPRDPILGVTEAYNADTRPTKVNLGVGVYYDENGKLPLLECVRTAEDQLNALHAPRGYLPIDGIALAAPPPSPPPTRRGAAVQRRRAAPSR